MQEQPAKTKRQRQTQRNVADKVVDPHRIFVMNLNFDTTEDELADHCASYGSVVAAELLTRGRNNRPSGSAIVEYSADHEAKAAIAGLEGQELGGRPLRVPRHLGSLLGQQREVEASDEVRVLLVAAEGLARRTKQW